MQFKKIKILCSALFLLCFLIVCEVRGDAQVFAARKWIQVPDGTSVSPFFNPKDCTSELPWDLLDELSIAMGEIQTDSAIHIMPLVTQITFVLSGTLEVTIKDNTDLVPSVRLVEAHQAVLTKPGSLFQLRNKGTGPCKVLYIVSPAYLFELDETGAVVYDDAFIVKETWNDLEKHQWIPSGLHPQQFLREAREQSYSRLAAKNSALHPE